MILTIRGQLPGLNDYTKACRSNRFVGAQMKADAEQLISLFIRNQHLEAVPGAVLISFTWYEPNEKRDPDNVAFAKKFILDALVSNGIIEGDSRKYVKGFDDLVVTDKKNPRIVVEITHADGL